MDESAREERISWLRIIVARLREAGDQPFRVGVRYAQSQWLVGPMEAAGYEELQSSLSRFAGVVAVDLVTGRIKDPEADLRWHEWTRKLALLLDMNIAPSGGDDA